MLWAPAVFGGLGVLALGLLVSAVVGPRWGPLGALATALCFPLLHVNRSTYSEPPAVLVLAAGLLVLVAATARGERGHDAARPPPRRPRRRAHRRWRTDPRRRPARDGAAAAGRRAADGPPQPAAGAGLLWGAGAATVVSAAAALGPRLPVRRQHRRLPPPPGRCSGSCSGLAAAAVVLAGPARGRVCPARVRDRLPSGAALLVLLAGVVLATRPLWRTERQSAADPGSRVVAGLQLRQGLPVDGGRTYAEQSLAWTAWWTGPVAVAIAFVVLAFAAHHLARAWVRGDRLPAWTGPVPRRPGVGPAHLGAPGHHPRPPVGGPAPVHRPAARGRLRGDGGGLADPVVHAPDVTGRARGRQRRHRLRAARARGDGDAAARAASGSSSARWRPPARSAGPSRPATWR